MLLSTGERTACALVAMAVHDLGHEAVSFTGSQAGILTDSVHTRAKIREITPVRVLEALRRREDRARRGLPGLLARHDGHHHARPRRGRPDGGRARRHARRVVRDLLRRARRLHAPTRASSRTPASSSACRTRRCWRWRLRARGCSRSARWSSRAATACRSTPARPSRTSRAPGSRTSPGWRHRSSRPSRTPRTRCSSRSAACPTSPAPRRRSSRRSPASTSASTRSSRTPSTAPRSSRSRCRSRT